MIDLDGEAPRSAPAAVSQLKAWVVSACRLGEDVTVMVSELRCREPGCPPLETVVAVMPGPGLRWQHTFHKAAADVAWHEVIHCACDWDRWAAAAGLDPAGPPAQAPGQPEPDQ